MLEVVRIKCVTRRRLDLTLIPCLVYHIIGIVEVHHIYVYSPNKGASLGRGSYLASIELSLDSRIARCQGT